MRVHFLNKENAEEWDDFVFNAREATVYHTYAWLSFIVETFGYKNISFFLKSDEGEIHGCLPLFEVRGFLGRKLDSAPFRDRGGILSRDNAVFRQVIEYAKQISLEKSAKMDARKESDQIRQEAAGASKEIFDNTRDEIAAIRNQIDRDVDLQMQKAKELTFTKPSRLRMNLPRSSQISWAAGEPTRKASRNRTRTRRSCPRESKWNWNIRQTKMWRNEFFGRPGSPWQSM